MKAAFKTHEHDLNDLFKYCLSALHPYKINMNVNAFFFFKHELIFL